MHVGMYACNTEGCVRGCASDLCMYTRARVCWYYFANRSTVSVCLPVHTVTQKYTHKSNTKNIGKY
jgi:hypothetical protein